MGYIKHQAIVVTAQDEDIIAIRNKAIEFGLLCSDVVLGLCNGYRSFLIASDGSKEGWEHSKIYDERRAKWIEWAKANQEFFFDWVLVSFGGDTDKAWVEDDDSGEYERERNSNNP